MMVLAQQRGWFEGKILSSQAGEFSMPGVIESYVHTGNCVGVLVEISCQTDVAAKTVELKTLAKEIAMQVAACPKVEYVQLSEIPEDVLIAKKRIEMERSDLHGRPESVQAKITEGRIRKRLREICLVNRLYIRDESVTVEDLLKLHSTQLQENIEIRRFARFVIDEPMNPPKLPPFSSGGLPRRPLPNLPDPLSAEAELD